MIQKFTNTSKNNTIKNVLLVALLFVSTITFAQPGSLDPTFNTFDDGTRGDGSGFNYGISSTVIQPDGKIIVGGDFSSFDGKTGINRIVRLNANGTLDTTFNIGLGFDGSVRSIALLTNGKIIVGGDFNSFNGMSIKNDIILLNTDGTRDTSFNRGVSFSGDVNSISVQSDGKIIVGCNNVSFFDIWGTNSLFRLNVDGTRDTTFKIGLGFNGNIYTTSIQPDGKIIVGGSFTSYNGSGWAGNRIVRLNPNGTQDSNFYAGFDDNVFSIKIQADGKIIVLGNFTRKGNTVVTDGFVRLNTDGTLDNTFNMGRGFDGDAGSVSSIAIQPDGKIIVGGRFSYFNGTWGINSIIRLNADGSQDTTFNAGEGNMQNAFDIISILEDGKIISGAYIRDFNFRTIICLVRLNANGTQDTSFNIPAGFNGSVYKTAIQPDGKIIVGGDFSSYNGTTGINGLVRLHANGTRDTTFNTISGFNGPINLISIQVDGKIIVGGASYYFNGSFKQKGIFRLHANGTLDTTFNTGIGFDYNDAINSIVIQADGKIIVGGNFTSFNGTTGINRIVRLNTDGSQDKTFNTGEGFNSSVKTIYIQADGKIIVLGWFNSFNGTTGINSIVRLHTNGTLDTSFNLDKYIKYVESTSIQTDGKIIMGHLYSINGGKPMNSILRLNTDGTRDKSFNEAVGFDDNDFYPTFQILTSIQTDGKIMVLGWSHSSSSGLEKSFIARLNANGSRDNTFKKDVGFNEYIYSISNQQDGKMILGGNFTSFNGKRKNRLVRLLVDATNSSSKNVTESQSEHILIFPNPNNGAFTMSATSEGIYTIQNSLGQIIQSVTLNAANNYSMNIENLSNGIYFVAGYNNNRITQQKVVVSK